MRNKGDFLFTSESVSEGHPDKVADRISDTVLDSFLQADPEARVACETLVTTNRIVLAGEGRGPASVTKELLVDAARDAVRDIGYDQSGFSWRNAEVQYHLHAQSADIAVGVDGAGNKEEAAGAQGSMFGFATRAPATRTRSRGAASRSISTRRSAVMARSNAFTRLDGRQTTSASRLISASRARPSAGVMEVTLEALSKGRSAQIRGSGAELTARVVNRR